MSPLRATPLSWVALALAVGVALLAPDGWRAPALYAIPLFLAARGSSLRSAIGVVVVTLLAVIGSTLLGRAPPSEAALTFVALGAAGALAVLTVRPGEVAPNDPRDASAPETAELAGLGARLALLQAVLDQLAIGVAVVETPSRRLQIRNDALPRFLDLASDGPDPPATFPRELDDLLARAAERGETIRDAEVTLQRADESNSIYLASAVPIQDGGGPVTAVVLTLADVTASRRTEEARAFLDRATALLASSLDLDSTLAHLARLLVAGLADWCAVEVRGDEWSPTHVVTAHRDADADHALRDLVGRSRAPGKAGPPDARAPFRTVERIDGRVGYALLGLDDGALDGDLAAWLRSAAALAVPLEAGGKPIGTILLARGQGHYAESELALAGEIGRRAGQAVDNARRYDVVQRTGEMRRRFLTVASHELRTPVTSLLGYAQVELRRVSRHGSLDPERVVTTLQAIERQARNLALLISRLLDVTMIDGGQVTLDLEEVDVAALVTKVVSRVHRQTSRHIVLMDAPERLSAWIDPFWIEKVLLNLLDNAIRYSPEGGPIEVSLGLAEPSHLILTVRDYGIGVPPDQLGRIFDRYVGAHEDSNRSGIGLGLSICRQIVEMHGGEVRAEAPETGGTRLRVTLPAQRPTRVSGGA